MNKLKMTMGVVAVGLMPLGFAKAFAVEVKLPADPKPYEQTAARELAHYLDLMGVTGPRFEIRRDDGKLKDEEWAVRREGDCFVFSGGGSRGALYAVYHFLEDVCGLADAEGLVAGHEVAGHSLSLAVLEKDDEDEKY